MLSIRRRTRVGRAVGTRGCSGRWPAASHPSVVEVHLQLRVGAPRGEDLNTHT